MKTVDERKEKRSALHHRELFTHSPLFWIIIIMHLLPLIHSLFRSQFHNNFPQKLQCSAQLMHHHDVLFFFFHYLSKREKRNMIFFLSLNRWIVYNNYHWTWTLNVAYEIWKRLTALSVVRFFLQFSNRNQIENEI